MMKNLWKALALTLCVWAALIMAGCGGGGSSESSLGPLPVFIAGSVADADRTRVTGEVTEFFKTVATQPDAMQRVINYMKTKPEIVATELSKSGDAVAWFKDGVKYMVIDSAPGGRTRSAGSVPTPPAPVQESKTRELPGANKAYLMHVNAADFINSIQFFDPALAQKGYDTIPLEGAVGDFAQIQDAGVLYINTLSALSRDRNEEDRVWYLTSTQNTAGNYQLYRSEIEAGTICLVSYIVDTTSDALTYQEGLMVSDKFLQQSGMSFKPNAIWINEIFFGSQEGMLQTAFSFNGLESYWAWGGEFDGLEASETTQFVLARFLGTPVDIEDDLPPYNVNEVQSELGAATRVSGNLKVNQTSVNEFSTFSGYTRDDVNDLTMIPSIRSAVLDKESNTMVIEGFFGSESGAVTIDGSTLNVLAWTPKKVTVEAPTATKGVLVLRSLGGASASGQLLSKRFEWEDIVFSIIPGEIALRKQESKSFTVSATGAGVPAGSTYKWTLSGAGLINGSSSFTGPATTVTFQAPNAEGETVLNVEILSPSGTKLGDAYAVIGIGDNRISYVASNVTNYPQLSGEHAFADGRGTRFKGQSFDEYEFGYNWDNASGFPRVVVHLEVPKDTVLAPGQEYEWSSVPGVGYYFGTTESLTDPTENGNLLLYGNEGKLLITSVSTNPNGSVNIGYSFKIGSDADPDTFGSGAIVVTTENP